ncbi:hypothetical protein ACLOJK_004625 [Asimina triloba]
MGFPSICCGMFEMPKLLTDLLDLLARIRLVVKLILFYLGLFDPTDLSIAWDDHIDYLLPPDTLHQMTPRSIKEKLPITEFVDFIERFGLDSSRHEEETMCAVCLGDVEVGDEIRELPNCLHMFHVECLDKWVDQGQLTCPLCRSNLLPDCDEGKGGTTSWVVERISYLFGEDLTEDGN